MADLSMSLTSTLDEIQSVVLGTASPGAGVIELRVTSGASHHAILKALRTLEAKVRADLISAP
ncbi:MAG: hypothetical protein IT555_10995 [Acetobacteraceae bacterium]|nr:hypothetical protein [Acetobacteraceae bacterium]